MKSLEQLRAAHAYAAIEDLDERDRDDVVKHAVELPFLLQKNGLLAAWAYLLTKRPQLLDSILTHLRAVPGLEIPTGGAHGVLQHWLGIQNGGTQGLTGGELRDLTAEAIAYAVWLKRAAKADVPDEAGKKRSEGGEA